MIKEKSRNGGFTLVELLVGLVIIAALAGISYPLIRSGVRASHKATCLGNLKQIGVGLEAYLQDNGRRMPDLEAGRSSRDQDIPVLETVLDGYLQTEKVFHCPADKEQFSKSGSSYLWNVTLSGLKANKLSFFGIDQVSRIPLVVDKESWHGDDGSGTNYLYADRTAENHLRLTLSP